MRLRTTETAAICLSILLACFALALPVFGQTGAPGTLAGGPVYSPPDGGSGPLQPASNSALVTLDCKDANVKNVLLALFRGRQVNFSIDAAIDKPPYSDMRLNLSISAVPFVSALKSVCLAAKLVYRLEGGDVYLIMPKPQMPVANPTAVPAQQGPAAPQPGPGGAIETGCPSAAIPLPSANALDQIAGLNLTADQRTENLRRVDQGRDGPCATARECQASD